MTRDLQRSKKQASDSLRNFAAAMLTGGVFSCLYFSFDSAIADDPTQITRLSRLEVQSIIETPDRADMQVLETQKVPNPQDQLNSTAEVVPANPNVIAIRQAIDILQQGVARLDNVDKYSFIFNRQERIEGELRDEQQIAVKLRHAPFSVYMKWMTGDRGRELLYTENENDGRMLVKLGGLKGRFVPTLKLDPHGERAKAESQHPVTQAGLKTMANELIKIRMHDLELARTPNCIIEEGHTFNDRPCIKVYVEYASKESSPEFRKAITLIDKELSLPVYSRSYTWPNENMVDVEQESLVSCYQFSDIVFETELADATWNTENPDYRFR
ncbi:MAG TPA: hypothetical protein DD473_08800 [Planctomycetaceae bacterium]|nr:hypothetical protein [Planctomycetaceae bacterium]